MSDAPIYDSAARPPAWIEEMVEAWKYRNLIAEFTRRDIVTRYKRSTLGVVWTMLNPLGTMLIMMLVFYQLFHIQQPKYPIYVLVGLIVWNFFAQVTAAAPQTLLWSHTLIHRVYMPRTIFVFVAAGAGLVNLLLSFVPLALVMVLLKIPPSLPMLSLPLAVVLLVMFSVGLGLLLSAVVAFFPDVLDIYTILLMAWLYVSAIFYPYNIIPEAYRWWFFNLNPMYHIVLLFRDPLYYGNWPSMSHIAAASFVAVATLVTGWLLFAWRADELAYRI
jgi:ABC-type polysaccharide/polyol phosphate export permease